MRYRVLKQGGVGLTAVTLRVDLAEQRRADGGALDARPYIVASAWDTRWHRTYDEAIADYAAMVAERDNAEAR